MKAKDHTVAALDHIAEILKAAVRINPDNPTQAAFNVYGCVDRLNAAIGHMRIAAGLYEAESEKRPV